MEQNTSSLRTRIVHKAAKGFWIFVLILLAITIWLFYTSANSDSDAGNAAGIFGVITALITLIATMFAITISVIAKGSKRLDSAVSNQTKKDDRVIIDQTDQ